MDGSDILGTLPEPQAVWEAAAAVLDARSASPWVRAALRAWASEQMREMPGRVWRWEESGAGMLRTSFRVALEHAVEGFMAQERGE